MICTILCQCGSLVHVGQSSLKAQTSTDKNTRPLISFCLICHLCLQHRVCLLRCLPVYISTWMSSAFYYLLSVVYFFTYLACLSVLLSTCFPVCPMLSSSHLGHVSCNFGPNFAVLIMKRNAHSNKKLAHPSLIINHLKLATINKRPMGIQTRGYLPALNSWLCYQLAISVVHSLASNEEAHEITVDLSPFRLIWSIFFLP